MRKDGWFHEHEHTHEFHMNTYFCDPPIAASKQPKGALSPTKEDAQSKLHAAGPFFAVEELASVQRAREEMYDEFDEQNTHTELVNRLFEYALGDAGGAGDEDPGTEVADK